MPSCALGCVWRPDPGELPTMRDLPPCPVCGDVDWSVPAELSEPCYIRFDRDDPAYHTDNFGPRVYLQHTEAELQSRGAAFCTSCGWAPSPDPADTRSLQVNEPLLRERLVQEALDYEGTWPTVNDHPSDPPWPDTYGPT
jgi:hypothetical protein